MVNVQTRRPHPVLHAEDDVGDGAADRKVEIGGLPLRAPGPW